MKRRISKVALISKFGKAASLWTDIVATNTSEKYHITAKLQFDKNDRARWLHFVEPLPGTQATLEHSKPEA